MSAARAALLRACSLLCLVAVSRQLSIKEFVVPYAVELGENAELQCQYELEVGEAEDEICVKWWWRPSFDGDRKLIYQRIIDQPAESMPNSNIEIKENDTIVLLRTTLAKSGVYECEVYIIDEIRKHDELVVFTKGTGPELIISPVAESSDDLLIECEAQGVAPVPYIAVTFNNGEEINVTEIVSGPDANGSYSIFANATLRKDEVTGVDIRCELLYDNPNITHPQYINVESYNPAGDEESTTKVPDDIVQTKAAPDSLQNSRDESYKTQCSWMLPALAAALVLSLSTKYFPL